LNFLLLGGSSNGSRRERQHLVRDNHHSSHGMQLGFAAPEGIRSIDSDSNESNRSKKSGASVLQQIHPPHHHPGVGPSYMNHPNSGNGDANNHNSNFHNNGSSSTKPSEFFIDVM
jgi:hypothetical protein